MWCELGSASGRSALLVAAVIWLALTRKQVQHPHNVQHCESVFVQWNADNADLIVCRDESHFVRSASPAAHHYREAAQLHGQVHG